MSGNSLPGWPWRLFATVLALACMGLGMFADVPVSGVAGAGSDSLAALDAPDTLSVRVLNGSGVSGLARRVQRFFQGSDDPAVWMAPGPADDADSDDYSETVIISHVRNLAGARAAASLLGLSDSCIVWELGENTGVDLTIILGSDVATGAATLIPYSDQ